MVNLSNVNNVSDMNKPISNLEQTRLNTKMDLSGGTFTGDISTNGNIIFTSSSAKIKYYVAANDAAGKVLMSDNNGNLSLIKPTGAGGVGYPTISCNTLGSTFPSFSLSASNTSTDWVSIYSNGFGLASGKHLLFYKLLLWYGANITYNDIQLCITATNDATRISETGIYFTKHKFQPIIVNRTVFTDQNIALLDVSVNTTYYIYAKLSYTTSTNSTFSYQSTEIGYIYSIKIA
jgi:hypothetical protein